MFGQPSAITDIKLICINAYLNRNAGSIIFVAKSVQYSFP